jgi:hypothetical protein
MNTFRDYLAGRPEGAALANLLDGQDFATLNALINHLSAKNARAMAHAAARAAWADYQATEEKVEPEVEDLAEHDPTPRAFEVELEPEIEVELED